MHIHRRVENLVGRYCLGDIDVYEDNIKMDLQKWNV